MAIKDGWIIADREGLAELRDGQPKSSIVSELVKNAWDENTTRVTIDLTMKGRTATLVIEDDSADGWKSLDSAFTLFRKSYKKNDPTKRGRYEAGDKFAFVLCQEVIIETMNGTVRLLPNNKRKEQLRKKRERGTKITCILTLTKSEYEEICTYVSSLIPPKKVAKTLFNGRVIPHRQPLLVFKEKLPTVQGVNLARTERITNVEIYLPLKGEKPGIYEMGVRIVDTEDKYIVNVNQKVPLNIEQNVLPAYYRKAIRVTVANYAVDLLEAEDMANDWVQEAAGDERATDEFYTKWKNDTLGEKAVILDPTRPDSNDAAHGDGATVVPSRGLTPGQRRNAKRLDLLPSAGKAYPTEPNRKIPGEIIPESEWSEGMQAIARYTKEIAKLLLGTTHRVEMIRCPGVATIAQYSGGSLPTVRYNTSHSELPSFNSVFVAKRGDAWLEAMVPWDDLIIHELGHYYGKAHDKEYRDGLTLLAAKLKRAAIQTPAVFGKVHVCRPF